MHAPSHFLSSAITPTRGAGWLKTYVKVKKKLNLLPILTLDVLMQSSHF
jgi:hypothetical protein